MSVPFVGCMALAAVLNRLPPEVLPAIQAVEGGTVGTVAHNANGTDDLGVMQLNTSWLPALARLTAVPVAELRVRLVNNACLNITVAGVILRSYLAETGGDLWRAVGFYHSHTPVHYLPYQIKVARSAMKIMRPQAPVQAHEVTTASGEAR